VRCAILSTFFGVSFYLQQFSKDQCSDFSVKGSVFGVKASDFHVKGANSDVKGRNFGVFKYNF